MNTKGASAAGKSTMRPEQKMLADRIGVAWSDFALISPDIWRKQLLDYASLGAAYKYGGACTSEELSIIDQKLDRYMARKARTARDHAPAHRPLPLRQLRAGVRRGRQQPADALRAHGVPVLHDHAAGIDRRARVEARPRGRPLQGGRRPARAQHRGVRGHAADLLHVGAARRQGGPLRIPGQHGAATARGRGRSPSAGMAN